MNVTILGCGAFGTALAYMFKENNCKIKMWNKFDDRFDTLKKELSGVFFTTNMVESLDKDALIVIAVPVKYFEDTVKELSNYYTNQDILIATKGIDTEIGMLSSDIVHKYIKCDNIGAISGGSFAVDMKDKKILGLTLGTNSNVLKDRIKHYFDNKYLKIQYYDDIIGVQLCGANKNVMAIGHGILDGANYPESSRFLFLTDAVYEIMDIIKFVGGNDKTIMSYAGIDDIMMTCTSSKSRNYSFGVLIGKNSSKEEIDKYIEETTIEGLASIEGIKKLLGDNINKFVICNTIYNILYNNASYQELVNILINKKN